VQVIDNLTSVDSLVYGQAIAGFGGTGLARYPSAHSHQASKQLLVLFGGTGEVGDVLARDNQDMDVCDWIDVIESHALIV